ncbi:MAG: hypothetical protein HZB61_10120 [Nitrospirae bacterium]|nr:hypothetical protein [Nitrospirota bacterium]
MGEIIDNEDDVIKETRGLSPHTKNTIHHHIANSLTPILAQAQITNNETIEKCVNHILKDLERFGIRETGLRF